MIIQFPKMYQPKKHSFFKGKPFRNSIKNLADSGEAYNMVFEMCEKLRLETEKLIKELEKC